MIQRPHQILSEFANQGYRATLYNLNSQVQKVIEIKENFYSYNRISPPFIKENKRVLWISYPPLYKQMTKFEKDLIIFDCIDYPEEQFKHWKRGIDQLRQDADFIFVTSQKLYEFNRGYKDKTYFCQNGADFNHFAPATNIFCDKPDDIRNIKGPVIGYFGAVADWIDWKLIKFLAEKNQFSIVIIGPLFKLREFPVKRENLFYLGEKDYGVLPDYLQCFDVCIIPFLKNKLTSACNPIKMYEYLSAGKPVITTDLEECRIETIKTSKTYQEFYDNITLCLNNDDAIQREKRIHFARQNSWMQRVRSIRSVIEPRLEQ